MTAQSGSPTAQGAFTLMEMMVAVAAVAIIAVGLSAIFRTITQTVTGGQRVSAMTQYAATLESQIRRDFARMTREGFIVIRQQTSISPGAVAGMPAPGVQLPVYLHKQDSNPRVRRVDEIMFVASGDYQTAREALNPEMMARSNLAAIYYGHGLKPLHTNQIATVRPNWNEENKRLDAPWLGERSPTPGLTFPNQYASDWTLLRRATLLAQPEMSRQAVPRRGWPNGLGPVAANVRDTDNQIMLQPAVSSLFRAWSRVVMASPTSSVRWDLPRTKAPTLASGMLDIATTDAADIKFILQSCNKWPDEASTRDDLEPQNPQQTPVDGRFAQAVQDQATLNRMHAWMCQALPAQSSMKPRFDNASGHWIDANNNTESAGARMRYEEFPPDYLGVISAGMPPIEKATRRADQSMLAGARFAPRCTEFIVEWSFGEVDAASNRVKWYGTSDVQADGSVRITRYDQRVYRPFSYVSGWANRHVVDPMLIYSAALPGPTDPVTACFGQIDPTYRPPTGQQALQNPDAPQSIPWVWPKLIRITMSIADDKDPGAEERFQFVLEVPPTPAP